jgi:predicted DCC family thiol-disulfide oxidoreductase YuxK
MERLVVLYDDHCGLCVRCRDWMSRQPAYVTLEFLPSSAEETRRRYGLLPWLGDKLVVVADDGRVWAGSAAFLVCLWALADFREWSYRLSGPTLAPLAERFFRVVSAERRRIAALFDHSPCAGAACAFDASRGPYR